MCARGIIDRQLLMARRAAWWDVIFGRLVLKKVPSLTSGRNVTTLSITAHWGPLAGDPILAEISAQPTTQALSEISIHVGPCSCKRLTLNMSQTLHNSPGVM